MAWELKRKVTILFIQAYYDGKNEILQKMASFAISQDALDIVQKIGPSKFIEIAKSEEITDSIIWQQYQKWFVGCPERVKEFLYDIFGEPGSVEDDESWLKVCSGVINLSDFECLVDEVPKWYKSAPAIFKFIMNKAWGDLDVVTKDPSVEDVVVNYLAEAIDVAKWAELI